ncbi:hypothetical protein VTO73DRAFT_10464 [Trametes versicolor]
MVVAGSTVPRDPLASLPQDGTRVWGPRPGELGYPKATLAGVLLLARYCRRLTSLDFPVDIRKVPRLDERHPPVSLWPSYESPLERFCPSGPAFRVDDVQDLAMFLSVIFPKLQSFGFPRQDDSSSSRVMYMHRKFLTIRWQERRWMLANGRRFREPEPDPCSWEEGDEADLIRVDSARGGCQLEPDT